MKYYLIPFYFISEYLLILKLQKDNKLQKNIPEKWKKGERGDFIIIHGITAKWNFLKKIGDLINNQGYRVHTLSDLGNNTLPVVSGVRILEDYIRKNNLKKFNIVSHSKGGIISAYFLKTSKYSGRTEKVINIATPYKGSITAYLFDKNLIPKSEIIKAINRNPMSSKKIFNLYPKIDNHVIPNKSLILKDATNLEIDIFGHTRILLDKNTLKTISEYLEK